MDAFAINIDPAKYSDESLKLQHEVQKLRWMGLDAEAGQLAREIERSKRGSLRESVSRTVSTLSCC